LLTVIFLFLQLWFQTIKSLRAFASGRLNVQDFKKSKAAVDSLQQAGFAILGWDIEWHYNDKTL
jgi:hypothetical protein